MRRFYWINIKGKDWKEMIKVMSAYKPRIYHYAVKWEMPQEGTLKCNTDGACRGNPGIGAYGFCLRDNKGDLIYAEAEKIGQTTNVEAEMKAILEALKYCVSKEVRRLVIESDSLLMVNIINKTWRVPWELAEQYDELQQALMKIEAIIRHTFREGNKWPTTWQTLLLTMMKSRFSDLSNNFRHLEKR
ncbi:hypothetical protein R3W88_005599 [Solanum pinnatisectum]|uniref:RNase H type-1 domain-containing protein n=1 Tax=Solanum pinnatisectum TaxID=50273 RepID=A0AAV9KCF9_9SOLN|nr:hypothetical protein R3W88_005599 [Solanum pinnatisectum]